MTLTPHMTDGVLIRNHMSLPKRKERVGYTVHQCCFAIYCVLAFSVINTPAGISAVYLHCITSFLNERDAI